MGYVLKAITELMFEESVRFRVFQVPIRTTARGVLSCLPVGHYYIARHSKIVGVFVVGGGRKRVFKKLPGYIGKSVVLVDVIVWERRITVLSRLLCVDRWCMSA